MSQDSISCNATDIIEQQPSAISSFGVFWRRDDLETGEMPKILGSQGTGAPLVDFSKQTGIYVLYKGRKAIHVGRSMEGLGASLFKHIRDHFSSSWDRFSWFGLRPVSVHGRLGEVPEFVTPDAIIRTLGAILIETLEPRQNRDDGGDLSPVEYIQAKPEKM